VNFTHSPIGDCADEDRPYPWLGDLLIAVLMVLMASAAYWWGTS